MYSCVLNMNLFTCFALVFQYCAISGIIMLRMAQNGSILKTQCKTTKEIAEKICIHGFYPWISLVVLHWVLRFHAKNGWKRKTQCKTTKEIEDKICIRAFWTWISLLVLHWFFSIVPFLAYGRGQKLTPAQNPTQNYSRSWRKWYT